MQSNMLLTELENITIICWEVSIILIKYVTMPSTLEDFVTLTYLKINSNRTTASFKSWWELLDINRHNKGFVLHNNWNSIIFDVCMCLNHLLDIDFVLLTNIYMNKRYIPDVPSKGNILVFWKCGECWTSILFQIIFNAHHI